MVSTGTEDVPAGTSLILCSLRDTEDVGTLGFKYGVKRCKKKFLSAEWFSRPLGGLLGYLYGVVI